MKGLSALIWKDMRINRCVLLAGLGLLFGPFLVGVLLELNHAWPSPPRLRAWANLLYSYGHFGLNLAPVSLALLAGHAIACERVDRSAEFLAYLPPSRWAILASKLAVVLGLAAAVWGVCLASMYLVAPSISRNPADYWFVTPRPALAAAACVLTFGVGWLGSARLENTTAAVSLAVVSPLALMSALQATRYFLEWPATDDLERSWLLACVALGTLGFAAGTCHYVRRVEP